MNHNLTLWRIEEELAKNMATMGHTSIRYLLHNKLNNSRMIVQSTEEA